MEILKLLFLLPLHMSTGAVYQSTVDNSSITSEVYKKMADVSECRCKAECAVQTECVAVTYDGGAGECLLGGGGQRDVTTHTVSNSVTFFKFKYGSDHGTSTTPQTTTTPTTTDQSTRTATATESTITTGKPTTTTADTTTTEPTTTTTVMPVIFATSAFTKNGSLANLEKMCAAEGGVPITIKTMKMRIAATNVTKTNGKSYWGDPKYVWLVARDRNGDSHLQWGDGSNVVDGVAFVAADIEKPTAGPCSFLREDGKIEHSAESTYYTYPVLCVK